MVRIHSLLYFLLNGRSNNISEGVKLYDEHVLVLRAKFDTTCSLGNKDMCERIPKDSVNYI